MARKPTRDPGESERSEGAGSFLERLGLYETGNGLPHGPGAIVLGLVVVLAARSIRRVFMAVTRR